MRAVLLDTAAKGAVSSAVVSEVPKPRPGVGEILVEMKACGLCGTDVEKIRGHYTASMPVLGHEAVGIIAEVGPEMELFRKGDSVFPHHHVSCGECYYCRHGAQTMCDRYRTSNISPGGFSEYFVVPAWNVQRGGVLKIPANVSFEHAAMIEPVACCLSALRKLRVGPDDSVLVVGAGPVGMSHAIILSSKGARVTVSDVSGPKVAMAEKLGVGRIIDTTKEDVTEAVKKDTAGRGADFVIVATGDLRAITAGLRSVRRGGTVCLFGVPAADSVLDYDISKVFNSEISITTSYGATDDDTKEALGLMSAGRTDFRPLISHRFPVSNFADALDAVVGGRAMKVIVTG